MGWAVAFLSTRRPYVFIKGNREKVSCRFFIIYVASVGRRLCFSNAGFVDRQNIARETKIANRDAIGLSNRVRPALES